MIYKTLQNKQKIENQQEPHNKTGVNSCSPEG